MSKRTNSKPAICHTQFNLGHEGACGEGDLIGDVKLPPWASSAHDFVRIHREALESEYVSANLHHWIDLIFGYKQRGDEAIKAKNVFYYLTYTGAVDLESIHDPQLRKGLEDQIRHFGQTPVQLLTEPHPSRRPLEKKFPPLPVHGLNPKDPALVAEQQVTPDVPIALVQLSSVNQSSLLSVSYSQLYAFSSWSISQGTTSQPPTVSMEPDANIWLKSRLGDPLDQSVSASAACFTSLPSCEIILVCGFWDNSFKCFASNSGDMIQSVFGHRSIVTCVDFSPEDGLHGNRGDGLVGSGSQDTTVLLWKWSGKVNRVTGPLSLIEDSLVPVAVLTGHEQSVASISVSCNLGIVVSGSKYGFSLVHTTYGELLHKLVPSTQWLYPHLTTITRNGSIVIHYADQKGGLVVYTFNGEELCQQPLGDRALALVASHDGCYIITGGFGGVVRVFHSHNLHLKYSHESFGSSIRSLHMPADQKFIFAGLASGSVAALTTHFWMK